MIDIKFLRENPEIVKENIRKKFQDEKLPLVDEAIRLDAEKRKTQMESEQLKAARNKLSKANGPLFGQLKKCEDEAKKAEIRRSTRTTPPSRLTTSAAHSWRPRRPRPRPNCRRSCM